MSFREKSAWIVFVSVLVVYAAYFGALASALARGAPLELSLGLFILSVVVLVAFQIIGHVAAALSAPREANAPMDERDRIVEMRSAEIALPALGACLFLSLGAIAFGADVAGLANLVLLSMVVATLVEYGAKIRLYRATV